MNRFDQLVILLIVLSIVVLSTSRISLTLMLGLVALLLVWSLVNIMLLVLLLTGVSVAYPGLGGRCVRTGGSLAVPAPAPLTSATALRAAGPLTPLAPT